MHDQWLCTASLSLLYSRQASVVHGPNIAKSRSFYFVGVRTAVQRPYVEPGVLFASDLENFDFTFSQGT